MGIYQKYRRGRRSQIIGTLSYWYSDSSSIGYWTVPRKIYLSYSESSAGTAAKNAATQWTNPGVSSSFVTSGSNMTFACYPYSTCVQLEPSIPTSAAGYTTSYTSYVGDFEYGSTYKRGYEVSGAFCYLITDTSANYVGDCAHELGHAFGWMGHSTSSSDIMYAYANSPTNLTTRDKNHLNQVY